MNKVSPLDVLESGLKAASLRQSVIASNIANLDTPGYRRREVQFQELLSRAMQNGQSPLSVEGQVITPNATEVDSKGNDVNLDLEIGELIKNSGTYKTYMRLLGKMYQQMELAIRE